MKKTEWNCSQVCPSRRTGMFCGLGHDCWDYLNKGKTSNIYQPRQALYYEGNRNYGVYCINSGRVKLYKSGRSGRQQIIHVAKAGEVLGIASLLANEPCNTTAETLEETRVCFIEKTIFLASLKMDFRLVENSLSHLGKEVVTTLNRLESAVQKPVKQRVAEVILSYIKENSPERDGSVALNLSRVEMAEMADTAPETFIRSIRELESKKYIKMDSKRKRIKVLEPELLAKLAD